jgi:hypothetical protein
MRIPNERRKGWQRLLWHRPDRTERELLDRAARNGDAFLDYTGYLANVWMPRHPVRARVESRLTERPAAAARRGH